MTGNIGHWRVAVWGTAVLLLFAPLVAMQFTGEVAWDGADFIVFGAMLFAACGAYELVMRMSANGTRRAIAGVAIVAVFLLTWAGLAVGS